MVRRGDEGDLAAVMEVAQVAEGAPHWSEGAWVEALRGGVRGVFVAEEDGRVVGFVVMTCAVGVGEVESVAVSVQARRRGVGRALLMDGIAWARERGAEGVELEVRASSGAIGLYRALGFVEQGRRRGYYRDPEEDAVLMALRLEGGGMGGARRE